MEIIDLSQPLYDGMEVYPGDPEVHKLSRLPYKIIKLLGLQKFFINTTAGYEYYKMADKGLFRYCIFTGSKPE